MTVRHPVSVQTLIIGAGFAGIGMAKSLKRKGYPDFRIVDESHDFGGTWHLNRYPGCACDIPTELYSFSDEPWPWKQLYSRQEEIREYLVHVAEKHGLRDKTDFGQHVERAEWDDATQRWHVHTASGRHYIARFVVSGVGALNIPQVPNFRDLDEFEGKAFHSARWDQDASLRGKRVAIIGTGASAIQIVPNIIGEVSELQLYQRTPPWVIPDFNVQYPERVQWALEHVPFARRLTRGGVFGLQELILGVGMTRFPRALKFIENTARWNIARAIDDPKLRAQLTPNWTLACKRLLKSNGWYPAIANPKTTLVTDGIQRFTANGIVAGGVERQADVVIFATGFHVSDSYTFMDIKGRNGIDLVERWNHEGVQAHLGVTVADMPNLFFMLGPNTGYGHNSVVFNIECQIRLAMQLIQQVQKRDVGAVVPRREVQDRYNGWIQEKLAGTVWDIGGCMSWYNDSHGVNRTLFPRIATKYWAITRRLRDEDYEFIART